MITTGEAVAVGVAVFTLEVKLGTVVAVTCGGVLVGDAVWCGSVVLVCVLVGL